MNFPKIDWIKTSQIIAIVFGILGILVLVAYVIVIGLQGYYSGNEIILENFAKFGDFIGGLVGSLWAFAGVLLFYVALMYKRRELDETIRSRDNLKLAYDDQRLAFEKQIKATEFSKFQTLILSLYESFREVRSSLRTITDQEKLMGIPPLIQLIQGLNGGNTNDKIIKIGTIKKTGRSILRTYGGKNYSLAVEFCETFYIIVHNSTQKWVETNDPEYLKYESLVIRSLTEEELLIIFFYGLQPEQELYLGDYFKVGKEWKVRMNMDIRINRPKFYEAWEEFCSTL